jgi:hypothetical protein
MWACQDGTSEKIMVGTTALGGMRSMVEVPFNADFITICSPLTTPRQ